MAGVQAWIALHEQQYSDALTLVDLPLAGKYDLAWYYDLRALCHLALGEIEAARRDFAAILTGLADGSIRVTDGAVQVNAAIAHAIAGDIQQAAHCAELAREDITANDDTSYPAVAAFLALAANDLEQAAANLRTAVMSTNNHRELNDLFTCLRLRVSALPDDAAALAARERVIGEVEEELADVRRAELDSEDVPTPEIELAKIAAEASGGDELARIAELAIEGRRLRASDVAAAAGRYELLRGSLFEPEATIGLARTTRELSDIAVANGEVDDTRGAQRRLIELGESDAIDAALAVSAALRTAGNLDLAVQELAAVADVPADDAKRDRLEQALGDLKLVTGDAASAERHFDTALALARDDPSRVAELETRAAIAVFVGGNYARAASRVLTAIGAWRAAGAFEPLWAIVQEARAVLTETPDSAPTRGAVDLLLKFVKEHGARQEADAAPASSAAAGMPDAD